MPNRLGKASPRTDRIDFRDIELAKGRCGGPSILAHMLDQYWPQYLRRGSLSGYVRLQAPLARLIFPTVMKLQCHIPSNNTVGR